MSSLLYHTNVMLFTTKIDKTITVIVYTKKLHVSLFQISSLFLIPKQKTRCGLANGIEDFQLRGHSCVNNVQHCLCHLYTRMRHSRQTGTSLLTKRHANIRTAYAQF